MKAGLHIGKTKILTITVTNEMFAQFDGKVVHPVYSTASMVYHMEWVSRQLLIPYLEDHEEGMGAAVRVQHVAPSGLGSTINLTATVSGVSTKEITTEVYVENARGLIGKGKVKQVVLPKKLIQEKVRTTTT
ncbi:thioesterase [Virgibacillus pantothenticus]|uniref:thioesterase family protein n=1 Tax=Virgibacillus pantothenticus TaxID=1473 RepID=UPI001C21FCD9|nr:thioesterase [Virgibacillus pantothenticus]MBU8565348.1 thioesterase [Virgibacillus pantothenticus]MBU8599432.1 thioesterase [Virgibacillus pantothenticus]MBU8633668.1 thioesterase [Virgibacillus pantothenticus]MBU8641712.1 thioesterase [Virgibacillus pantothenticus]MBU8645547.1 thioesterase [Virgibacillus pantothenticus]